MHWSSSIFWLVKSGWRGDQISASSDLYWSLSVMNQSSLRSSVNSGMNYGEKIGDTSILQLA